MTLRFLAFAGVLATLLVLPGQGFARSESWDPVTKTATFVFDAGDLTPAETVDGISLPERIWVGAYWDSYSSPAGFTVCPGCGRYPEAQHIVIRTDQTLVTGISDSAYTGGRDISVLIDAGAAASRSWFILYALDSATPLNVASTANGLDMNGDGDVEVTFAQSEWGRFRITASRSSANRVELGKLGMRLPTCRMGLIETAGFVYSGGAGSHLVSSPPNSCSYIRVEGGSLTATTGNGADSIWAARSSGNAVIDSGAGDDGVTTGPGNDTVRLGPGNDGVQTGAGNDKAWGGTGNDRLGHRGGGTSRAWGEAGNDHLSGGAKARNFLFGGAGNDFLRGTRNAFTLKSDRWDCGKGRDTAMYRIRHMKHCETISAPNLKP